MQVIKLNRRWRQFKEHGHQVCFKFDGWSKEVSAIEQALRAITSQSGYDRGQSWYSYYGAPTRTGPRPYFITIRDEATSTLALLRVS
jgi:hypothetical protein